MIADLQVLAETFATPSEQNGLLVLSGAPGCGRSHTLKDLAAIHPGPHFWGGGLAALRHTPGVALARAVRAPIPEHDRALVIEAVRARVGSGLLLLDDLHWADSLTLEVLPELSKHCKIIATIRTPSGLNSATEEALRAAGQWATVPALDEEAANTLAQDLNPRLSPDKLRELITRSGGSPLALRALLATENPPNSEIPAQMQAAHAVAEAVAHLSRAARTALAVLGLLGRPVRPEMLGPGIAELIEQHWAEHTEELVGPISPYFAQVAASAIPPNERTLLHARIAEQTNSITLIEAAQHWIAAGNSEKAHRVALTAAQRTSNVTEQATALALAAQTPHANNDERIAAARAALRAGRPQSSLRLLPAGEEPLLRAQAHLQLGQISQVRDLVSQQEVLDDDWARVWALAAYQSGTAALRERDLAPTHPALAHAVIAAGDRTPGWVEQLARASDDAEATDQWWGGWLLVTALCADGDTARADKYAQHYAQSCANVGAYSWHTRFLAVQLWCAALLGGTAETNLDTVISRALELTDRALPPQAMSYAFAAACLSLADTGGLAIARDRLAKASADVRRHPFVAWVDAEAAWLDGQAERALAPDQATDFASGLRHLTAQWAAHDLGMVVDPGTKTTDSANPATLTLQAWPPAELSDDDADEIANAFIAAAPNWRSAALREEIRCLLAAGVWGRAQSQSGDSTMPGLEALLTAEKQAADAGLVVLLGRVRRALRRYAVRREGPDRRIGTGLTAREREVLELVGAGEPTRRIAGRLGISRMTVETHVRAGMRKLGARTRTEAAALLFARSPETAGDRQ